MTTRITPEEVRNMGAKCACIRDNVFDYTPDAIEANAKWFADLCDRLASQMEADEEHLKARVAALKEALRPFAALTGDWLEYVPDDEIGVDDGYGNSVTMGDIREARRVLEGKG